MIADQILSRLDGYFLQTIGGRVTVATMSKQLWLELPLDQTALGGQFGWCWPGLRDNGDIVVGYCPEILAEITAHLEPIDRDEYLNAVEFLCGMFVTQTSDSPTREETVALADRCLERLGDQCPFTFTLMRAVHDRALELQIVPAQVGGEIATVMPCPSCGYIDAEVGPCSLCGTEA